MRKKNVRGDSKMCSAADVVSAVVLRRKNTRRLTTRTAGMEAAPHLRPTTSPHHTGVVLLNTQL